MKKNILHFILHTPGASVDEVKGALAEFAESIDVTLRTDPEQHGAKEYDVSLVTEDPTLVFDSCATFGRIKSVKVIEDQGHS